MIFISCGAKKPIKISSTEIKTDTIYKTIIEKEVVPVEVIVEKEAICDTVTGRVMDFTETIGSGRNKVEIRSVNGVIIATASFSGFMDRLVEEHRASSVINFKTVEVPVEVNKWWKSKWFWISIGLNILLLLYVFRRLIPILQFIP